MSQNVRSSMLSALVMVATSSVSGLYFPVSSLETLFGVHPRYSAKAFWVRNRETISPRKRFVFMTLTSFLSPFGDLSISPFGEKVKGFCEKIIANGDYMWYNPDR